jgi:excisionase family DNA binding protein
MSERRQGHLTANDCELAPPDPLAREQARLKLPSLLLKAEVAAILRYRSVRSVERLIARGELEAVRLSGRQVRIDASSLAAFLERRTRRASGAALRADQVSIGTLFGTIEPESLAGERP